MMRQNDKVKTSVFSEYQNNQNDSISSKQLEFWLKQTAPVVQPKFAGVEWTLMSTNSIFQQDEHTLLRNETFESINKENDQLAFNSARPSLNNTSTFMKSKSYVNAMVDLQNKVKKLQQQNQDLQMIINKMREERNLTLNESTHITQQLKNRLQILEPKTKKLQDLIKENKKLRDLKEQNVKKCKLLQKINKENVAKLTNYEEQKQRVETEAVNVNREMGELKKKIFQYQNIIEKYKEQLQRLQQKNKTLEGMKEKSTTSIIEKYNKSVEMMQNLATDNQRLKSQIYELKQKGEQKLRILQEKYKKQKQSSEQKYERQKQEINQNYRTQKQSLTIQNQRLKQQISEKKQFICKLVNQSSYFRQRYQKKNQQLINILQIQATQRRSTNQQSNINNTSLKKPKLIKNQNQLKQNKQEIDINRESIIKIQEEQINNQIESQLELDQINSNQDQPQIQQIQKHQTRSVGKQKHKNSLVKSVIAKPIDSFSHENMINNQYNQPKSSTKRKSTLHVFKSRQKSQDRPNQKSREKQKSRSKSREIDRLQNQQNQHSFILKSCEPITQQFGDHLMYSREPYYFNSANTNPTRQNIPYYWEPKEIPEFATSQKGNASSNNNKQCNIHQALLLQASKQAIRLIEEQQKCMNFLSQNMSQNERAECNGRMKQINEQISLNYQKMFELKSQIAQSNNN